MDQLPRLGKRELVCPPLFICNCGFSLERFPLTLGTCDGLNHSIVALPGPSI